MFTEFISPNLIINTKLMSNFDRSNFGAKPNKQSGAHDNDLFSDKSSQEPFIELQLLKSRQQLEEEQ